MAKPANNTQLNKALLTLVVFIVSCAFSPAIAQLQLQSSIGSGSSSSINYSAPKEYVISDITISGTQSLDKNAIILLTGLTVGDRITIPGDEISSAIRNLWQQGLFSDIQVSYKEIKGERISLDFYVQEQPRMSRFRIEGVKKSEADDIREKINLYKEKILTNSVVANTKRKIRNHFVDKGYLNTQVEVVQKQDTLFDNHIFVIIKVDKKKKVKINRIFINGNEAISDAKLKRAMKETHEKSVFKPFDKMDDFLKSLAKETWKGNTDTLSTLSLNYFQNRVRFRIFKNAKFLRSKYEEDKKKLISAYREMGYRDAEIVTDSVEKLNDKLVNIHINVEEGDRYYFRNIKWIGNSKYSNARLSRILGIEKGDVYNPTILERRLFMNQAGLDVSSLYMDNGYLFFQVEPVETRVENDSIDLELRVYEGKQARIDEVTISGNTKTHDHVVRRQIRTKPGDLFSRSDIMRTQRELSMLGYFDQQQMNVVPTPNPQDGTVDIEYQVVEKPSDQIELSGGWGGGFIVGTLGLRFSNFSTSNLFNKEAWRPLPSGDGQSLSIRAQTNGTFFQSYNISFTEPWLGGKRPNALTVSTYYSIQTNGERRDSDNRRALNIFGASIGLGKRLRWPDDNFQLQQEIAYQNYDVNQWRTFENFSDGHANNIFYKVSLSRSSMDDLYFPTSGSQTTISAQLTPPYSWFNGKDYSTISTKERFKFVEYHKWKFTSKWYSKIFDKFVLYTKVGFGGLFRYTPEVGNAPFERFYLGGSGLTGFNLDAREIIALRGYDDQTVVNSRPVGNGENVGGILINKYTTELRYPFSTNPQAMIYGLTFFEMGNSWGNLYDWNPFDVYRSAGVGVRVYLPMFGLLGLDWGYRFDDIPGRSEMQRSQVHFTIGTNLGQL